MEEIINEIRDIILDRYGLDINDAESSYSTRNYAFVFPDDYIIRISANWHNRDRKQLMAELLWLQELEEYSDTICKPIPSLNNNHFEEFEINGNLYKATKFKKAEGNMIKGSNLDNWHVMLVGDLLGRIHSASKNANKNNIYYERPKWEEMDKSLLSIVESSEIKDFIDENVIVKIKDTVGEIKKLNENIDNFGMIHGDFNSYNYYVDGNNVWVFDFDDCQYGFYIYDIATVILMWLMQVDANIGIPSKKTLFENGMLESFKKGYSQRMSLNDDEWDKLELFMKYRLELMLLDSVNSLLSSEGKIGGVKNTEGVLKILQLPLMYDDFFEGIDKRVEIGYSQLEKIRENINDEGMRKFLESDDMKPFTDSQMEWLMKDNVLESENLTIYEKSNNLKISGILNTETSIVLDNYIQKFLKENIKELIIDTNELEYISSSGIRILLKTYKKLDGNLKLINVNDNVKEVLDTVGLGKYLIQ
ncbi:phosphotransferase [Methanobrevibacter sp. OttesenSCG-928-K11]|nr:phosphotransferase [Methanobrevibacter sp. OttesenSCG-928-K11]